MKLKRSTKALITLAVITAVVTITTTVLKTWKWHEITSFVTGLFSTKTTPVMRKILFFHYADGSPARALTLLSKLGPIPRPDGNGNIFIGQELLGSVISVRDSNTGREITTVTVDRSDEIQDVLIPESLLRTTNGTPNGHGVPAGN